MSKQNIKKLDQIEEEMYSLIGEIDWGEISNVDTYWASLSDAILKLKSEKWTEKPKEKTSPSVSIVLSSLEPIFKKEIADSGLMEIIGEMERLSDLGSSDSIGEEDLELLQGLTPDLEKKFLIFLEAIRSSNEFK